MPILCWPCLRHQGEDGERCPCHHKGTSGPARHKIGHWCVMAGALMGEIRHVGGNSDPSHGGGGKWAEIAWRMRRVSASPEGWTRVRQAGKTPSRQMTKFWKAMPAPCLVKETVWPILPRPWRAVSDKVRGELGRAECRPGWGMQGEVSHHRGGKPEVTPKGRQHLANPKGRKAWGCVRCAHKGARNGEVQCYCLDCVPQIHQLKP